MCVLGGHPPHVAHLPKSSSWSRSSCWGDVHCRYNAETNLAGRVGFDEWRFLLLKPFERLAFYGITGAVPPSLRESRETRSG